MNFHDDSHILTRLGILQSKDESPHKYRNLSPSKERKSSRVKKDHFVEVSIDGDMESRSETDEEPVFDRNSLLSPNRSVKVHRRKTESFTCVYIIVISLYFATGSGGTLPFVMVGHSNKVYSCTLFVYSAGVLLGTATGKFLCQRLSINLLLFSCIISLCGLSLIISTIPNVLVINICILFLGFGSGNILYGGLSLWFLHWRAHSRKALFLYMILVCGSGFTFIVSNGLASESGEQRVELASIVLHKREMNGTVLHSFTDLPSLPTSNITLAKPRKPQVVQGAQVVETKSKQNEHMRKAVASNKSEASSAITASQGSATTNHRTLTVLSTNMDSATKSNPSSSYITVTANSSSFPPNNSILESVLAADNVRMFGRITAFLMSITMGLFLISFLCYCIPCSVKSDIKFTKMFDHSVAGLTRGCRIRLSSVQAIASVIEGLVEVTVILSSAEHGSISIIVTHYAVVTLSRGAVMICGTCMYTPSSCCLAILCSLIGSAALLMNAKYQLVGLVLMSMGSGVFGLLVLMYLEVRLHPRAGTQLDYYVIPSAFGRFLATSLCLLMKQFSSNKTATVVFFCSSLLVVLFMLLVKSIGKAAKLREIMQYTWSPVFDNTEDYISLFEGRADSSDEENQSQDRHYI